MSKSRNFALITMAGLAICLAGPIAPGARAADEGKVPVAGQCSVPVCDMTQEIARYRAMPNAGSRFNAVAALRKEYAKSTDAAVLRNLSELAAKLAPLFVELKDDDYVVREARALGNETLVKLAKYSELNATALAGYYEQITNEGERYGVITFWKERIKDLEDKTSLLELVDFFERAATISRVAGDSEYVAREARGGRDVITGRIVQLYPYFEGSYAVKVRCEGVAAGVPVPAYCQSSYIDRLVIMDTLGSSRLQISLSNKASGTLVYAFTEAAIDGGGTSFNASGTPNGVPSQLHVDLDRKSGHVSGWIKNADSLVTLIIEGDLISTPASVFDVSASVTEKQPLTVEELVGTFRGSLAGYGVSLTLQAFGAENALMGTLAMDQAMANVRFQASRFYPKLGMLVLVSTLPSGSHLKVALFFSRVNGGLQATGMSFTDRAGSAETVTLAK
jgi:hypothetical protein